MACIKEVNRSASVALSPDGPYMATGTMAGAVDVNFSTSASLEIFKLDFQSDDHDLPLLAESTSSERFNRLSWGKKASQSEEFPYGVIAGGLIDGTVCLWNPAPLIRSEANCNAVVWQSSKHKGPVRGLEFNTNSPYLLASGADDGEISIWDFATIENPQHFPPLKGTGSASQGEISYLSWNCKVHHILASTSYNGTTVVWDLRKQKPVISFADSTRRRCSVLQWNPDAATQLVVASDDDDSPALRLWDMRNVMSPVKEFVGHTKGVISMSWCHTDSSYLLTCAKDNRTICWDTVSGEIVCELPAGTNWNFDVHWYSKIPGVISASSFDGKVGIYNIEACSRYGTGEVDFVPAPLRAPKWYKRPVGVSFGFGGKLVSFQSTRAGTSEVYVHSIVTEDSLVNRSSEFEAAIQSRERPSLKVLCEKKSQESESEDDRETWSFLKVMFEDDGSARTNLLSHLGFSVPEDITETVQDDISEQVDAFGLDDNVADKSADLADKETAAYSYDNGEDFFNNLPSPKADTPVSTSANTFVGEAVPSEEQVHVEPDGLEESEDPAFDDAVQRALVVGDYKGAVAHCLSANKMADALVIAHVGGAALWESTRNQYLKISRSPYLKVVSAMVNHDLMSLVNSRPLKSWKETLALLCSFAQGEEWPVLCDTLGAKLLDAGNTLAATLCYICAGNIDQTVEIWSQRLSVEPEGKSYVDRLQDLMEKTIVFAIASGQKRFSSFLCKLVEKYAEILTSQGQLSTAMEYLKLLGEELSPELVILRDRITVSSHLEKEAEQKLDHDSVVSSAPVYSDQPNLQPYYQDNTNNYVQPTPAVSQYNGNYQQPFPDKSFTPPMPYQQQPQDPKFFVPSPVQPPTQPNFPSASAGTQPVVKPFVPAAPPALKDANKYQQGPTNPGFQPSNPGFQPSNTGFQPSNPGFQPANPGFQPSNPGFQPSNPGFQPSNPGYQPSNPGYQPTNPGYQPTNPGYQPTNPGYQPGPPGPGSMQAPAGHRDQRFSPVAAAAPAPMGFVPVNTPGIGGQRPGMPLPQPSTPAQPAPQPTNVAPPAPPPTVQTADTSNVPAHQKPVIATLTRLFKETSEAVGGANANPGKKREIDDNSRKLGALFAKLNTGDISKNAGDKLVQICQALDNGDYATALQIQVQLTTSDWDECSFWLGNLKRMIRARQNVR